MAVVSALRKRKSVPLLYYVYTYLLYVKNRKYWVHPFTSASLLKGAFSSMFTDLREDEAKFFNYFRMSVKSFDELCVKVGASLQGKAASKRLRISPTEMIAVTLRYLGSGCNLIDLHYSYRLGRSTLSKIARKVCRAIYEIMKDECLHNLSEEMWRETCARFEKKANFPNCLGAIDGKHVKILKPTMTGSLYYNYKNFFSIVLLAVADASYKFIYFDVGSCGKNADSTIFERSTFFKKLQDNSLNIPSAKPLPGTEQPLFPHVFVGYDAFGLSENVMRPYSGKFLTHEKKIFNYRLSRARRYVECTFGILLNKWRIFHRAINVDLQFAIQIVKCCCVLHNYVRDRDGFQEEETYTITGFQDIEDDASTRNEHGRQILRKRRQKLAQYFCSETGRLAWQDNMI